MKSNSDNRPPVFLSLGDGSWHYNYNIKEVGTENEDETARTVFEYDTAHIWGTPDYAKCVKAVLREKLDESQEFSLINKYNAYNLGLSNDENDKTEYEAYLLEVISVKKRVKEDMEALK